MANSKTILLGAGIACVLVLSGVFSSYVMGSNKDTERKPGATAHIMISASQAIVWKAVVDMNRSGVKVESETADQAIVEQRFVRVPFFGQTAVTFKVTMLPQQKADFEMIRSNCLKEFRGGYLLTPVNDSQTEVEMYSFVEPMLPIPQFVVNQFMSGKMHKRLAKLKTVAESGVTVPKAQSLRN